MTSDLGPAGLLASFPESPTPNPDGFSLHQEGHGRLAFTNPDDQLRVDLSTTIVPVSPEAAYVSSVVTIRSGTGRFAGATGTLVATGEAELATSKQVLRFRGQLCTGEG